MPLNVLLVEDSVNNSNEMYDRLRHEVLDGKIALIYAKNLKEARAKYKENNDIDVVVMDGSFPPFGEGEINGVKLVKDLRQNGYKGSIITFSDDEGNNNKMIEAGASHKSDKCSAHNVVLQLSGSA